MPDETLAPDRPGPLETPATTEQATTPARLASGAEQELRAYSNQTTLSEYLESLLVTVILALFGTSFVVQAFKIPSQSMERTLLVGDHLAFATLAEPVPLDSLRQDDRRRAGMFDRRLVGGVDFDGIVAA